MERTADSGKRPEAVRAIRLDEASMADALFGSLKVLLLHGMRVRNAAQALEETWRRQRGAGGTIFRQ